MANEIRVAAESGLTLTYGAYEPNGDVRTAAGTSLTEKLVTGIYLASDASVQAGDAVVVKEGSDVVGGAEYIPEVVAGSLGTQAKADVNTECDTAIADADIATETKQDFIDANVDAILLDTGTSGVVLADDSITSAKFDESTAFPIKATDSGSTYIARTGADGDTLETLSDQIDTLSGAGAGAITFTYSLYTNEAAETGPIPDADVWVTSDEAGNNTVASGRTNASGSVTFYLDSATYYFWRQKVGFDFTNPDSEAVA